MFSDSDFACAKKMNINAALAFVAVMQTGSLLGASIILDTSTPNVCILLKKFSSYFSNELFERTGRTLEPTKYAFELHKNMEHVCNHIIEIINNGNN